MKILSEEPPRRAKGTGPLETDPSRASTIQQQLRLPTITGRSQWILGEEKHGGKVLLRAMPPPRLRAMPLRRHLRTLKTAHPSFRVNAGTARDRVTLGRNAESYKGRRLHPQDGNNPLKLSWWIGSRAIIELTPSTLSSKASLPSPPRNRMSSLRGSKKARIFRTPDRVGLDQGN
jgi:hypothetical protein